MPKIHILKENNEFRLLSAATRFFMYRSSASDMHICSMLASLLCIYNKPIISEDSDKAHQIGTAYLVEHKRCNPLSALDTFLHWCQRTKVSPGKRKRWRSDYIHRRAVSPGPGELRPWRKSCVHISELYNRARAPHGASLPVTVIRGFTSNKMSLVN